MVVFLCLFESWPRLPCGVEGLEERRLREPVGVQKRVCTLFRTRSRRSHASQGGCLRALAAAGSPSLTTRRTWPRSRVGQLKLASLFQSPARDRAWAKERVRNTSTLRCADLTIDSALVACREAGGEKGITTTDRTSARCVAQGLHLFRCPVLSGGSYSPELGVHGPLTQKSETRHNRNR